MTRPRPVAETAEAPAAVPMRVMRHLTLWVCEAEWERAAPRLIHIWEPLETHAPEDARPYCCLINTVVFYERERWKEITRCEHYSLLAAPSPHLVWVDRRWWEVGPGQVVWRNDRWYFMHRAWDNTRAACWANAAETVSARS